MTPLSPSSVRDAVLVPLAPAAAPACRLCSTHFSLDTFLFFRIPKHSSAGPSDAAVLTCMFPPRCCHSCNLSWCVGDLISSQTPIFKSLYSQRLYMERVEARAEANRVKGNGAREGAQINGNSSNKNNNIKTPTAMAPPIVPLRKPPVPLMSLSLPFRPPTNALALAQCHRCQKHGHKKGSCRRAFVCMKCAGQHPTTACKKPRHVPPRCCNCGGRQISACKGCRVFQEVKKRAAQDTLRPVAPPERQRSHRSLIEASLNCQQFQRFLKNLSLHICKTYVVQ
ncbi:gag protein [Wolbachia endosymbiont of Drosophila ananassae]|nr:gag protein [Wolbachia endosymbiont of Drosophila ananassae]